ncbi:DUF3375 domain-containing protein [Embleya hyalina]|uniref:DUF3375 domain-containing protein n=1 Tax=Embleya hyalina TaxID=516124 RepID=UPI000F843B61|nr:DUF3375 domain-containing protein [Embleya hyalina]
MEFEEVDALRRGSPAWKLLRAEHAPLVLSFLGRVFVEENVRSLSAADLASRLDDVLYALNARSGGHAFPRTAKAYLDDWSAPENGWLRKYYPPGSDEAHFDATPAVEKALAWIASLQARSFVGTESRLNTAFELLRQMAFGTEPDRGTRLTELRRRRAEIDAEIARVSDGDLDVMNDTALRDRYQQFAATARGLLADFREVEENFRRLDRELRERVASWDGPKGKLLDRVLGDRSNIADSDQGRSFHAFYDFLLSHRRQSEFSDLLAKVHRLESIGETDHRMRRIHHDWLDAGERTQATVRLLSEQLRRFLDDQVWLENRRVVEILRSIEVKALRLRERPDSALTMRIDAMSPAVTLPMERPMYRPKRKVPVDDTVVLADADGNDVSLLFEQVHVDPSRLVHAVCSALHGRTQVGLVKVLGEFPLEQGLAELVTYLSLTDSAFDVVFDENTREEIAWDGDDGRGRCASVPQVTFVSRAPQAARR